MKTYSKLPVDQVLVYLYSRALELDAHNLLEMYVEGKKFCGRLIKFLLITALILIFLTLLEYKAPERIPVTWIIGIIIFVLPMVLICLRPDTGSLCLYWKLRRKIKPCVRKICIYGIPVIDTTKNEAPSPEQYVAELQSFTHQLLVKVGAGVDTGLIQGVYLGSERARVQLQELMEIAHAFGLITSAGPHTWEEYVEPDDEFLDADTENGTGTTQHETTGTETGLAVIRTGRETKNPPSTQ